MAIALDSTSNNYTNPGTSLTISHTCTGSNLILFVGVYTQGGDCFSGVTYNGVAMTQIGKKLESATYWNALYYLIAPATGTHDIVISTSVSAFLGGGGVSYTGVKQSAQPDASITASTTGTTLTTTLTTVADNCWTILTGSRDGPNITAGIGSTERSNIALTYAKMFDSNGVKTPAGSTSMEVTGNISGAFGTVMASFSPYVVTGIPITNYLGFF